MSHQQAHTQQPVDQQRQGDGQGQRMGRGTQDVPVRQTIEFQKSLAHTFLCGLELTEAVQRAGIDMSRNTVNRYLAAFEQATTSFQTAGAGSTTNQPGGQPREGAGPTSRQRDPAQAQSPHNGQRQAPHPQGSGQPDQQFGRERPTQEPGRQQRQPPGGQGRDRPPEGGQVQHHEQPDRYAPPAESRQPGGHAEPRDDEQSSGDSEETTEEPDEQETPAQ